MHKEIFTKFNSQQEGQLLLEILIAIAVAAIVISVAANFIFISLKSNKSANDRNVALGLVDETLSAVEAASTEKWQNLYNLTHGTSDYHPVQSAGKWDISTSSTDNVTLNSVSYTRGFRVYYICKDSATRNITGLTDSSGSSETSCTTSGGIADPSTQKVVVTVSFGNDSISVNKFLAGRFRNRGCNQTSWTTAADSAAYSCASGGTPTATYFAQCDIDTSVNTQLRLIENCP